MSVYLDDPNENTIYYMYCQNSATTRKTLLYCVTFIYMAALQPMSTVILETPLFSLHYYIDTYPVITLSILFALSRQQDKV